MTSPIGDEEVWKPYRRLVRFCVGLFVVVEDDKLAKFLVVGDERMGGWKGLASILGRVWRKVLTGSFSQYYAENISRAATLKVF